MCILQRPGRAGDGFGQSEEWGAGEQSVVLAVQVGIFPVVPLWVGLPS